jgi:hypothetical protein
MSAGSVLQSLAHTRDAAAWYGRAMQLADLVAAEDHSLQLYTLLHRYAHVHNAFLTLSSMSLSIRLYCDSLVLPWCHV